MYNNKQFYLFYHPNFVSNYRFANDNDMFVKCVVGSKVLFYFFYKQQVEYEFQWHSGTSTNKGEKVVHYNVKIL